mmetsp:Transcript_49856/g.106097  ORF Transcript_49856/g.106097 Transcript_49856/m.106097 type:complete len:300 (-) Transcript_49856:321-1220(-)
MGNLLAECRRVSVEQCELCQEAVSSRLNRGTRPPGGNSGREDGGRNSSHGRFRRAAQDYQPNHLSEAAMIEQAIRNSQAGNAGPGDVLDTDDPELLAAIMASAGGEVDEDLMAQAIRRAKNEEESRQRQLLLDQQEDEYEESLRVDQERQLQEEMRRREELEAKRRAEEEEEEARIRAETEEAEALEAEERRKASIEEKIAEAKASLTPEPEKGTPGRLDVMVKMPDGKRIKRAFVSSEPLGLVYSFVVAEIGEAIALRDFRLVATMPRRVFEDRASSMKDAGLEPQTLLLVEMIGEEE